MVLGKSQTEIISLMEKRKLEHFGWILWTCCSLEKSPCWQRSGKVPRREHSEAEAKLAPKE
jgi:hypothetical protein